MSALPCYPCTFASITWCSPAAESSYASAMTADLLCYTDDATVSTTVLVHSNSPPRTRARKYHCIPASTFSSGTRTVSPATTFPARDHHPANALPSHSCRNRSRDPHSPGPPSGIFASSSSSPAHSSLCTRRPVQRRLTNPVMRRIPTTEPRTRAFPLLMTARADAHIPRPRPGPRDRDDGSTLYPLCMIRTRHAPARTAYLLSHTRRSCTTIKFHAAPRPSHTYATQNTRSTGQRTAPRVQSPVGR